MGKVEEVRGGEEGEISGEESGEIRVRGVRVNGERGSDGPESRGSEEK